MSSRISPSGSSRISMLSEISVRQFSRMLLMQYVSSYSGRPTVPFPIQFDGLRETDQERSGRAKREPLLTGASILRRSSLPLFCRSSNYYLSLIFDYTRDPHLDFTFDSMLLQGLLLRRALFLPARPFILLECARICQDRRGFIQIQQQFKQGRMAKDNKKVGGWSWTEEKTCLVGSSAGIIGLEKVASFDMDDTIITRKSGAKFPKDAHDWLFLNDKVSPKVKELYDDGYKIVIFTNQAGIQKGHTKASDIRTKVENIAKAIGVEMQVFIAAHEDEYRKPGTKMWDTLDSNNGGVKIIKAKSFFCGDAAGRKDGKHKDFSDSDLKFALNVGIEFKTPENLFFGEKDTIEVKGFNPTTIPESGEVVVGKGNTVQFVEKEMVIFVGSPASGKSTFWQSYMPKYLRVNRDTLKTKEKCYKAAEEEMKRGGSVVIDNTNPKKEDRAYFLGLAKKYGYKARCFEFLTPKDICFHNDYQRVANDKRTHLSGKAGSIPIHSFFKYKEEPVLAEGFYEINKVNFITKFASDEDKEFYRKFSKK